MEKMPNQFILLESMLKDKNISKERKITILLKMLSPDQGSIGYKYLRDALILSEKDRSYLTTKNSVYDTISEKYYCDDPSGVCARVTFILKKIFKRDCEEVNEIREEILGKKVERMKNSEFFVAIVNYLDKVSCE